MAEQDQEVLDIEQDLEQGIEQDLEQELEVEQDIQEDENLSENSYVEDYDPENPTEQQEQAMAKGWKPEGVPGKESVTAKEFLAREPIFDRMHQMDKRFKEQQKVIDALKQHNEGVAKRMYQKAMKDISSQRDEAIEAGEIERVREFDKELDELKEEQRNTVLPEQTNVFTQEDEQYWEQWRDKPENSWIHQDTKAVDKVASYVQQFTKANVAENGVVPSATEIVDFLEYKLQKEFPERFMPEKPKPRQAVERTSRKPAPKPSSKHSLDDLEEQDRSIARTLIKSGQFTEQEYIKSLEESGYFN